MSLALLPLQILLVSLDFLITILTFGWIGILKKLLSGGSKLRAVKVGEDEAHRVNTACVSEKCVTPCEGCYTLFELSEQAFKTYADNKCMVQRQFLGWKTPKIKEFGESYSKTYKEVGEICLKFGAALAASGLVPAPNTTDLEKITIPCRMAIFENTCPEWMMAAQGAFSQSFSVTTIYATLGLDAVVLAINDNIIPVIVCNKKHVGKLVARLKDMPTLKTIIYTNDLVAPTDNIELPTELPKGVNVVAFDDFWKSGDTTKYPVVKPTPESTAVIMYTSGSTGKPKGVVITHKSIVAAAAAGDKELKVVKGKDVYVAYLPLAHIMELMAEFCIITVGCTICYADPKSLSTTGAYPTGALEHYSPTIFIAVPKIWDTIKKGIEAKIAASSPVAQTLVATAMAWRTFAVKWGFDAPLFNAIVFKKFKKAVGGRLRFCVSGGGALNAEVQKFIQTAFGFTLVQGYGLTETCAGLTFQDEFDDRTGIAGVPIASVEAKLISTPDICDKAGQPYLTTDRVDVNGDPIFGRGEILCKGESVSSGYYMMPEATKESFGADGWFHTGDIGQFMDDGSIKIVDRKKNLVKLKGGEYIALEQMEMAYGNSTWVDAVQGGICCYGDADMDRPVALMQLKRDTAMAWAKANDVKGDFETLLTDPKLYDAVMEDMKKEQVKAKLSHLEKLVAVCLLDNPWTPENGCLTAANKLQRKAVIQMFEKEFNELKTKGVF